MMKKSFVKAISLILALLSPVFLAACTPDYKENNGTTAVTVGDFEVSYDLYSYFYLMYQKQGKEQLGISYSQEELMAKTEGSLKEIAAAVALAKEYDVELDSDRENAIHDGIASIKDGYDSDDEFYAELANNFMSEQVMFDVQYYTALETQLREYLTSERAMIIDFSDKALESALESKFMAAVNILIFPESEKDGLRGKELADAVYQKILDGEDIYKLARTYSDDSFTGNRYFAPRTTHKYFEDMVASLEIGEMSQVYQSELGYNITKRVAIDREYVEEYYEDLRDEFAYSEYLSIVDTKTSQMTVKYTEDFNIAFVTG